MEPTQMLLGQLNVFDNMVIYIKLKITFGAQWNKLWIHALGLFI